MKNVRRWILVVIMASLLFAGCGKQPSQELQDAQARIEDLKNQGAALYMKEEFVRLDNELATAMNEVQVQDKKFIRNYEKVKGMLASIIEDAETLGQILPPIKDARLTIDSIPQEDAALYAKNDMRKLYDDFGAAMNEVRNQNAQPVKDYEKAKGMLARVKGDADGLMPIISTRKEEAMNRTLATQKEAQTAIEEAKRFLETAMRGKKARPDIDGLMSQLKTLDNTLAEVQTAVERGDYLGGLERALSIKEKAGEIREQGRQKLAQVESKKKSK